MYFFNTDNAIESEADKRSIFSFEVEQEHYNEYESAIMTMTANAFKENIDKCIESGMNNHIAEPIDKKYLWKKYIAIHLSNY